MSNIKREELEQALLGFKGGYGGQSLSSLMQLIDQYTQGKVDEALGKPELETPEQILEKLKLSSWSMGLQGASEKELDNERQVQITVSQALVALDRYYKAQLADIKERK